MSIKVLIVDDEPNVAKSVNRLLMSVGYDTTVVQGGDEALDLLQSGHQFNVVVSDQRMPKMTGAQLFEKMQQQYPLIKRILLTGYTDLDSLRAAVNNGHIYRFLLKPWDDDELIQSVTDAAAANKLSLENQRLNQELKEMNSTLEERIDQKTRVLKMNLNALERYEDILEQTPIGIMCVSEEDMVVLANNAARDMLQFRTALEGLKYNEVLPEELAKVFQPFSPNQDYEISLHGKTFQLKTSQVKIKEKFLGRLVCFWAAK